jgi:hypothetical protein
VPGDSGSIVDVIHAEGGSATFSTGAMTITVPAAAVQTDVTLTISPASSAPAGSLVAAVEIGPVGTRFDHLVAITFDYSQVQLGSVTPDSLHVATVGPNGWTILPFENNDQTAKTITASTSHLSVYGLISKKTTGLPAEYGPYGQCCAKDGSCINNETCFLGGFVQSTFVNGACSKTCTQDSECPAHPSGFGSPVCVIGEKPGEPVLSPFGAQNWRWQGCALMCDPLGCPPGMFCYTSLTQVQLHKPVGGFCVWENVVGPGANEAGPLCANAKSYCTSHAYCATGERCVKGRCEACTTPAPVCPGADSACTIAQPGFQCVQVGNGCGSMCEQCTAVTDGCDPNDQNCNGYNGEGCAPCLNDSYCGNLKSCGYFGSTGGNYCYNCKHLCTEGSTCCGMHCVNLTIGSTGCDGVACKCVPYGNGCSIMNLDPANDMACSTVP